MSLEQKNKPELVKLARELDQENKILNQQLEELKAQLQPKEVEQSEELDLPYTVATPIQVDKHKSIMVVVNFNEKGQCEIIQKKLVGGDEQPHYKIHMQAIKYNEEVAFKKNKRKERRKWSRLIKDL